MFTLVIFYDLAVYFPKFSILAFYFNIIPSTTMQNLRIALYCVTAIVSVACLTVLFGDIFWCKNIADNW
jgi:hypothetical protein